ncbi:unnamed protein product [Bursaphelenchus xylophilus]|uniref:(pine wood nematode) hypothetical protein n=1 Tax=Bursaphelenchus xylophilus TaxID=6326 RepID=A0A1I7SQ48_BURXY|nr:unnamed protein product [Bursaphelenchus xylophilus]CAG9109600.1 unnamed protein product [Bursaphelenchus xylophilus]
MHLYLLFVVVAIANSHRIPAQYFSDTGTVSIRVGAQQETFNLDLTTLLDKTIVFSKECLTTQCLNFRDILHVYDDSNDQHNNTSTFLPGLNCENLNSVPIAVGSLKFTADFSTFHPNGDLLDTSDLEEKSFKHFEGYLPLRFGRDHLFDTAFEHVPLEPRTVTFVPAISGSLESGMYIGDYPPNLCEPFGEMVQTRKAHGTDSLLLMNHSRVTFGANTYDWNVFIAAGPKFVFNQNPATKFFGRLVAEKRISEKDFQALPPNITVPLPGIGHVVILRESFYAKDGGFYYPLYIIGGWAGDFGLNQATIKDKCFRLDKTSGEWTWGFSHRTIKPEIGITRAFNWSVQ